MSNARGAVAAPTPLERSARPAAPAVRAWLYAVAALVVAMILVGGATRLTDSGLSITEWQPIHGTIPPLSDADWQAEFEKYKQIPEYALVNDGMSLSDFKAIFWWEWGHRLLGRFIGVAFALPLAAFWIAGRIPAGLKPRLLGILALGALQGAVGWWMVASGLVDRVDVSQYRLAVHLTLACVILAAIVATAEALRPVPREAVPAGLRTLAGLFVAAVFAQIFLGGLVAGLKAGWTYNTWPLIDGAMMPGGLLVQSPWWLNPFENPKTVQFDHRMAAYLVLALAIVQAALAGRAVPGTATARRAAILAAAVLAQAATGVAALVTMVPLELGLAHQLGAAVVLWLAVAHAARLGSRETKAAG
jgi:cytochrome c oxidase assembly protein subunit 15